MCALKTPTGTKRVVASASRPTPVRPTRATSSGSVSTTAKNSDARKTTRTTPVSTASGSCGIPVAPKVDIGHKAYEVWPGGAVKVIRFCVDMETFRKRKGRYSAYAKREPYFVYDMDTGGIAAKTSKTGYATKKEAVKVARAYRDKYGAYAKVPF
jgi:hypothetical protein